MSDLNCELMGKFKVFLLGVPLALGVLAGCSEEVEYEMPIYDFVNPSVCFFVSDAATGVNLLDPDEPDAILGRPIAVTYGGKRYEVAADAVAAPATRATMPRPLALRLEGANEYDRIKGYHLAFGEFDPTDGLKGQSFVVDWGDGTSTKVEFDLYVVWKNDKAHYTLSDGETPAGVNALCLSGRTLYAAGHSGGAAAVWKDKELLYTLTDGSSYAEATAVCRFGHTLYTAGYHTDGFEEEGVVWKEGQELFDLSDDPGSGSMPYSVAVCYDDIFTAGTIFGTTRTAVVWHGDEIRYTLSDGTGHSEAYSMYVVPLYD